MIVVFSSGQPQPSISGEATPEQMVELQIQLLNVIAQFTQAILDAKNQKIKELHDERERTVADVDIPGDDR